MQKSIRTAVFALVAGGMFAAAASSYALPKPGSMPGPMPKYPTSGLVAR